MIPLKDQLLRPEINNLQRFLFISNQIVGLHLQEIPSIFSFLDSNSFYLYIYKSLSCDLHTYNAYLLNQIRIIAGLQPISRIAAWTSSQKFSLNNSHCTALKVRNTHESESHEKAHIWQLATSKVPTARLRDPQFVSYQFSFCNTNRVISLRNETSK